MFWFHVVCCCKLTLSSFPPPGPTDGPRRLWPCTKQVGQPWWGCGHWGSHSGWRPRWRCDGCAAAGCHAALAWHWDPRGGLHQTHQPQHHHSHQEESGRVLYISYSVVLFQSHNEGSLYPLALCGLWPFSHSDPWLGSCRCSPRRPTGRPRWRSRCARGSVRWRQTTRSWASSPW